MWQDPDELAWAVDFDVTRRAFLAGLSIECYPRITLLKFPSPSFHAYAPGAALPQPAWWDRISRDPVSVEVALATDLARLFAQERHGGDPPLRTAARDIIRMLLRAVRRQTIASRPVWYLERARQRRQRRRKRRERGLPG
jgi:hypothetical protein